MAEPKQTFKKLEDQLNCPICLDTYTDPKQLQCNHVFCQQCLVKMVVQDQQGQLILTCPNCRQVTPIPTSGVAGLTAAFQTNQLLEIVKEHKKVKAATSSSEKAESVSTIPTPHTIGCPEHGGREVELYCETCEKTICFRCIKKGEKHNNHDYEELDEAFERYKGEITSSLEPMEKHLTTIKRALEQLDTHCEEIANQQATTEADIHKTFGKLHETLDVRKAELINQLHQLTQTKLKSLAVQRDQIETTQAQLNSFLCFMRENLKTDNQGEALIMKSNTIQQVKKLTNTFQLDAVEPIAIADLTFILSTDTAAAIQNYGHVYSSGPPDPFKCVVMEKLQVAVAVEERSTIMLQTFNSTNQPTSNTSAKSIMCELVSEMTGARVLGTVEKSGQSQYEISYQPTIKGKHQLHIKVKGQHISGSPFPVIAKPNTDLNKFEIPLLTIYNTNSPEGVAVNNRGEVLVAEAGRHCISVFSSRGEKLRSFGSHGSGQGHFKSPYGVAVDGNGCILVTDKNNHRIQKFTEKGKFLAAVGSKGQGPLQFSYPQGIAYNPSNDAVYVADWNCHIQILESDLSYRSSFGKKGRLGCIGSPRALGFDSQGNVYVADYGNHCVQVFTAEGKYMRKFGKYGVAKGELRKPSGLSIDSTDRVYVSEMGNHRVSVFTSEGQFLTSFGRKGSEPGEFDLPAGLVVDSCGIVYASDCFNHRVQIL